MKFFYRAFKDGKIVKGNIEADNNQKVKEYLRDKNLIVIEIKAQGQSLSQLQSFFDFFGRVNFTDVVALTRQLSIMINAGLTIVDSLDILRKQITKPSFLKVVDQISEDIRGGTTLSSALEKRRDLFSNLYISLVRAGEASGKLDEILLKLAENLEIQREFRGKIKGALIYPIIVIIAMLGVMFVMITFVLPKLLTLYQNFNISLPLSTQIMIAASSFLQKFWPVVIVAVFVFIGLVRGYLRTKPGKKMFDSLILKIPKLNKVTEMAALVDTTRTFSILINAGVPITETLTIIVETSGNVVYQEAFAEIAKKIEKGQPLGKSLEEQRIFPPILVQMATVGEETGHLDETLMRLSKYFQMESELAIKAMTTMIEPLILIVLGLGVGVLVMSVITPIYNLTSSFK